MGIEYQMVAPLAIFNCYLDFMGTHIIEKAFLDIGSHLKN